MNIQDAFSLRAAGWPCGRGAYRFADVDARFGDRLAGLAVKALWKRGRSVAALPGLQGQLVGNLEGLAECQDDLIRQVLTTKANRCECKCDVIGAAIMTFNLLNTQ